MYYIMTIWQYNIWSTSWSTDFPQPLATLFFFLQEIVLSDLVPIDRMGNQVALAQARGSIWTIFGLDLGVLVELMMMFSHQKRRIFVGMAGYTPLDFPMIIPLHPENLWKIPSIDLVWFGRLGSGHHWWRSLWTSLSCKAPPERHGAARRSVMGSWSWSHSNFRAQLFDIKRQGRTA